MLIAQSQLGKSETVAWVAGEKGNEIWKGIWFCVPAPCWKNDSSTEKIFKEEQPMKVIRRLISPLVVRIK